MSDFHRTERSRPEPENDQPQGPSLKLLYSLIGLALLVALALAAMIVFPFYERR